MSLLFSYYGDDFTGSTDALESLAARGLRAVLFLGVPSDEVLAQFSEYQAIGVAGDSRSRSPEWMKESLPPVFAWLRDLCAPIVQYKVCSTFDSSPTTGNIGVALQIGRDVFDATTVPIVVAAPHLKRYVLFGNLFAAGGDQISRIDRHPTMSQHPATPMREADLRLHLAKQTSGPFALIDILALHNNNLPQDFQQPAGLIFDGLDEQSELLTGRLLWENRAQWPFVVGSSGLTRALMGQWVLPESYVPPAMFPADRLIVVSGSCSPVTEEQIRRALGNGFEGLQTTGADYDELLRRGSKILAQGRNLIVYSALGPQDFGGSIVGEALGRHLGTLLRELIVRSGVRRAVIAGGDTSSHAAAQLGIHALTFAATLAPGVPLCRAHSVTPPMDGVEIALKGGQVGGPDFFEKAWKGQQ